MNCKPGDLAIVVRAPRQVQNHIGKIVVCARLTKSWDGVDCWLLKTPFRDHIGLCEGIADRDLRPIRDPGDDAQDESFRWAPAPEKVLA